MSGFYDIDLAATHAERHAAMFDPAFEWLAAKVLAGPRPAVLFDLGCGDGRWLEFSARRGIPGAGADLSPAFVALARRRGLNVVEGRASEVSIPAATTAVTALGEVLSYVDALTGVASLTAVLKTAAVALPPGGVVLADLVGPGIRPAHRGAQGPGWSLETYVTVDGDLLTRDIDVTRNGRRSQARHVQKILAPEVAARLARQAGFSARILQGYGPCALLPGRYALSLVRV